MALHASPLPVRSHRSFLFAFGAMLFGLFLVACGPPYSVIKQASPNPFVGATKFVVMPIDYTGLHVGSKSAEKYEAGKSEKQADSFEGDKEGINNEFQNALRAKAGKNGIGVEVAAGEVTTFVIKPFVSFVEPGFYAYVASHPSKVEMTVKITDKDGKELDEIMVQHESAASMTSPSSGGRLRSDGDALGGYVARYLMDRTAAPEKK